MLVLAMLAPFALAILPARARHAALVVMAASLVFASAGNVRLALRSASCREGCPLPQYGEQMARERPLPGTFGRQGSGSSSPRTDWRTS